MLIILADSTGFGYGMGHTLNWASILAVIAFGFLSGFILSTLRTRIDISTAPMFLSILVCSFVGGIEVATAIGLSINAPNSTGAYFGSHLGYILLSVLYVLAGWLGVYVASRTVESHSTNGRSSM